jgi:Uma2 family endonuclease
MGRSSVKLTYADLVALPEDGLRHELIDGEHYVSPSPTTRHQIVLGNLFWVLEGFVRQQGQGRVLFAPVDVFLSESDILVPDLVYVSNKRLARVEKPYIRGAPDLVVEVLSPSTRKRDVGVKRRCYEEFGVAEYWIVDPELETVEVFRQSASRDGLRQVAELSRAFGDGPLMSPLFPGLALSLDQLFD